MRLIDADALDWERIEHEHGARHEAVVDCEQMVEKAPTIDAVPVVRCKDCRWWDNSEDSPFGYCMAMRHGYMSEKWEIRIYRTYKGDFYCADAERKDDD